MTRSFVTLFLAAGCMAIGAQLTVPLPGSPVPVTLQTLAVVWVGTWLVPTQALAAGLLYLAAGAAGLPVFAASSSGWEKLVGPTAGFLWSFPLAAGFVATQRFRLAPVTTGVLVLLTAHLGILGLGGLGLWASGRPLEALSGILVPLLPGALAKSLAAWLLRARGITPTVDPGAKT